MVRPDRLVYGLTVEPSFEGYEIRGVLGSGAQGTVYRALERATGVERALKVLEGPIDPESVERFRREAQALARLSGRGVVPIHHSGVERSRLYFVMDVMHGSLEEKLAKGGRHSLRDAVATSAKLARTLERAHALGLVHRDLKPANVLFDDAGEPRISDWGCVRDLRGEPLTQTGAVLGTPAYMSPEQLQGMRVDGRADVFALGVMLHEMVSGERPFVGKSPAQLYLAMRAGRRGVSGPAELEAILDGALALEPASRPSAAKLAAALEALHAGETGPRSRLVLVLPLVLAAVAVTVFGAWPRSRPPLASPRAARVESATGRRGPDPNRIQALRAQLSRELAEIAAPPDKTSDEVVDDVCRHITRAVTTWKSLEAIAPRSEMPGALKDLALSWPVQVTNRTDSYERREAAVGLLEVCAEAGTPTPEQVFAAARSLIEVRERIGITVPRERMLAERLAKATKDSAWAEFAVARWLLASDGVTPPDPRGAQRLENATIRLAQESPEIDFLAHQLERHGEWRVPASDVVDAAAELARYHTDHRGVGVALASIFIELGELGRAKVVVDALSSVRDDKDVDDLVLRYAVAVEAAGDEDEAQRRLEREPADEERKFQWHWLLARSALARGDEKAAREQFRALRGPNRRRDEVVDRVKAIAVQAETAPDWDAFGKSVLEFTNDWYADYRRGGSSSRSR